ncbi:hypothetical protein OG230_18415 [Streptomyces sp. NBC_00234]|uniref:hypothetical protein n=1 Tax=Streptomyces sp. NBC_00234 TaxID=2903638 RepID=UPI002E2B8023|nr:hypothetical protein [Streptomyces sp. NBC_00234]
MNLRMAGLSAAVLFTVLLPLAASAVTSGAPDSVSSDAKSGGSLLSDGLSVEHGEESEAERAGEMPEERPADGSAEGLTERADGISPENISPPGLLSESGRPGGAGGTGAPAARCGPELTSPEGVEAQTCVMAQGREVWARTYYRNTTGEQLRSFLTLMGPGGRAVELRCEVAAHDEPGVCETPRAPAHGATGAYTAVAEYAAGGAADEVPLLLRTGSNPVSPSSD